MKTLAPHATSLALFALASVACGDDAASTAKYAASNLTALCQQYGNAICDRAVACGIAANQADCAPYAAEFEAGCSRGTSELQAQVDQGAVVLSYSAASACLAEVAASCVSSFDFCTREAEVVVGQRAIGAACGDSQECVTGAFCKIEGDACGGLCSAVGAEGGACESSSSECADDLLCLDGKCAKGAAKGAACSFDAPCGERLACDEALCKTQEEILAACPVEDPSCVVGGMSCSGSGGGTSVCQFTYRTFGASGAACDPSSEEPANEDVTRACKLGLVCDPTAKTCGAPKPSGAACPEDDDVCGLGAYCDATNKCATIPAKGQACADTCADDLACIQGTCQARLAAGGACTADRECESHDCVEGHCAAECTSP